MNNLGELERLAKVANATSAIDNRFYFAACKDVPSLISQLRGSRDALRPFAALAAYYDTEHDLDTAWDADYRPKVGDLRRARNVLENKP